MTQPETEIRSAWRQIAGPHHDGYVDDLLIRYAEPHRHYHTATHIMFVLRHLRDMCLAPHELSREVIAAALYHDAIYEPRDGDNEARSATIASADLAAIGWPPESRESVAALIRATAGHLHGGVGEPGDSSLLLDADLAILGADPGAYQAYVNGVRAEYDHVDDDQWVQGRAAVLRHFLDRPRLFITHYMFDAREHRARANIEAELAVLSHQALRND
ncbi:MAG: metal-dependent phosphohydrolase [Ilumatobacteraceae bacterium]